MKNPTFRKYSDKRPGRLLFHGGQRGGAYQRGELIKFCCRAEENFVDAKQIFPLLRDKSTMNQKSQDIIR